MLDVENIPVVSVPVMATESWMQEGGVPAVKMSAPPVIEFEAPAPPPARRFLSEDEEPEPSRTDAPRVMVGQAPAAFDDSYVEAEPQLVTAAGRPKFAEMEEPSYTPLPRDYASETGNGVHASEAAEERRAQPAGALFAEAAANAERDLDVPAFMRRVQF
jgi:hypothetical protein